MSRYIDEERIDWRLIIPTNVTIAEENMIHLAKKLVERQPTADVAPVVHGKWIPMADADEDNNQLFQCSNCGGGDLHAIGVEVSFCWKCGARMDLQDREENR